MHFAFLLVSLLSLFDLDLVSLKHVHASCSEAYFLLQCLSYPFVAEYAMETAVDDHGATLVPRSYQLEMLKASLQQNVIVAVSSIFLSKP